MKLLFIRHGDPNYEKDCLTELGKKEAALLAERMAHTEVTEFFVSPMGRARETAQPTLDKVGRTATMYPWLQEFSNVQITRPSDTVTPGIAWDWLPADWTKVPDYYDKDKWCDTEIMKQGHAREEYEKVIEGFDKLLGEHGYVRENNYYRAEKPNRDTLAFFCHFGLECVLIGHLIGVSPMVLWHGMCAAPTSITEVNTEERRPGIASFRVSQFGDIHHLQAAGEKPSLHARFCETYDNMDERHD